MQQQIENRRQKDRRQKPTPLFNRFTIFGRRGYNRREVDRRISHYVDRYSKKSIVAFVSILILCALDAKITTLIMKFGGDEINPLMKYILKTGSIYFRWAKYITTTICLIVLMIHKNFYIFNGRVNVKTLVSGILILYSLTVLYEIFLLISIQ